MESRFAERQTYRNWWDFLRDDPNVGSAEGFLKDRTTMEIVGGMYDMQGMMSAYEVSLQLIEGKNPVKWEREPTLDNLAKYFSGRLGISVAEAKSKMKALRDSRLVGTHVSIDGRRRSVLYMLDSNGTTFVNVFLLGRGDEIPHHTK